MSKKPTTTTVVVITLLTLFFQLAIVIRTVLWTVEYAIPLQTPRTTSKVAVAIVEQTWKVVVVTLVKMVFGISTQVILTVVRLAPVTLWAQ